MIFVKTSLYKGFGNANKKSVDTFQKSAKLKLTKTFKLNANAYITLTYSIIFCA